jgi:hypothetical protein
MDPIEESPQVRWIVSTKRSEITCFIRSVPLRVDKPEVEAFSLKLVKISIQKQKNYVRKISSLTQTLLQSVPYLRQLLQVQHILIQPRENQIDTIRTHLQLIDRKAKLKDVKSNRFAICNHTISTHVHHFFFVRTTHSML